MAKISSLKSNVPVVVTTSPPSLEEPRLTKKGAPRKRRPWSDYEEASLLKGLKSYGEGNWTAMLADPTLRFDDRTSMDLKDKFRNLQRKRQSSPSTFQITLVPRQSDIPPNNITTRTENQKSRLALGISPLRGSSSTGKNHEMLATQPDRPLSYPFYEEQEALITEQQVSSGNIQDNKSLREEMGKNGDGVAILKEIRRDSSGELLCLMAMEDIGERVISLNDIPSNLYYLFQRYRDEMSKQIELVDAALMHLRRKDATIKVVDSSKKITTKTIDLPRGIANRIVDSPKDVETGIVVVSKLIATDKATATATTTATPSKAYNTPPLAIVEAPTREIKTAEMPINIVSDVKRAKLVQKMNEARADPKNCTIQ